jgi:dynein heavy chain
LLLLLLLLLLQEDRDEIINAIRGETKSLGLVDTPENCWATFINKVKANLHVAFTASPVGEAFRMRSQRFLATINSTVIDWFQPWSEVSLLSVARKFLDDVELESEAVRNTVVEFMPFSFAAVNKVGCRHDKRKVEPASPCSFALDNEC